MSELALAPAGGRELSDAEKRTELIQLVVDSVRSEHSKRAYRSGLEQFFAWWEEAAVGNVFSRALVQRYRAQLEATGKSASTINQRLAPLRKLAEEAAFAALLPSAIASEVRAVKGAKQLGVRTGNWLTREQAEKLLLLPKRATLKGKRDYALLALFLGAGLRRDELARLEIEDLQQRENRWCLVDLQGKGNRIRTVAIPAWAKQAADGWIAAMPFSSGLLLGKVNKGGRFVGQGMSAASIYGVVLHYAEQLGVVLKPHDLRRTYGKLAHKGGARIEQIQLSYGHASLTTTERYLGIDQDLEDAPCDHLQLKTKSSDAAEEPAVRALATPPPAQTKTVRLRVWLTVENNSKFVRGKKKARQSIEQFSLARYGMRRGARANEYEIIVPYADEDELHHVIEDLQQEISWKADLRHCFAEADMQEIGSERQW